MTNLRNVARKILEPLQAQYQTPHEIVRIDESSFTHLDFDVYAAAGAMLEGRGYKHLADVEFLDVSNDPASLYHRTLIREFLAADGNVICAVYQLKPIIGKLLRLLAEGLRNLRWIDAPKFVFEMLPTRMIMDLESELSDGRFIVTSNAEASGLLTSPPTIQQLILPYNASLELMLDAHASQLSVALDVEPATEVRSMKSYEDVVRMGERLKRQKNAHRAAVDWISESELIAMSDGNIEQSKELFREVQALLREQESH